MKKFAGLLGLMFLLTGCGTTWYKAGVTQHQFNVDKAHCQALANGAAPMQHVPVQGPTTTYHSGTVYGSNGSYATYSGTSMTPGNYGAQMAGSLNNFAAALRQSQVIESCMISKGYSKDNPIGEFNADDYKPNYMTSSTKKVDIIKNALLTTNTTLKTGSGGSISLNKGKRVAVLNDYGSILKVKAQGVIGTIPTDATDYSNLLEINQADLKSGASSRLLPNH